MIPIVDNKSFHLDLAGFLGYKTGYTHIQLPEVQLVRCQLSPVCV